jgi:hypothetical protein
MKSNRLLFQLAPSKHRISEKESGSLPTPRVSEAEGAPVKNAVFERGSWSRQNRKGIRFGVKVKDVLAALGLKLHPGFLEWMMGYPIGWTELDLSATRSSPKWPEK